jgi:hypothetical protein
MDGLKRYHTGSSTYIIPIKWSFISNTCVKKLSHFLS